MLAQYIIEIVTKSNHVNMNSNIVKLVVFKQMKQLFKKTIICSLAYKIAVF